MRGDWSVFDRPASSSGLLEAERPWGSETSTSYSVSSFGVQAPSFRAPSKRNAHKLTFSLSPEDNQSVDRRTNFAANSSLCLKQQRQQSPLADFASISSTMCNRLSLGRDKQRKLQQAPVAFEFSSLQPDTPATRQGYTNPHQRASLKGRSKHQQHQQQSQSIRLDCFQLQDAPSTSGQSAPFGSLSLSQKPKRKRQPVSIWSHSFPQSAAIQSTTVHQDSRSFPVMELAQNSANLLAASDEQEQRGSGGADVAATGRRVKKSVLKMPSQLRRLFAGAFAGALSKTAIAPIETIRMQVMGNKGTVAESIGRTWGRKGILGFFSGNSADILRVMPSKAIELTCFDAYKRVLSHQDEEGKLCRPGPLLTGLAGAAAGATSTVGLYPLETLRTRLAMGDYDSLMHAVRTITAEEGFMAFYQGIQASLIGILPYAAIRLGVYDGLKWSHRKFTKKEKIPPIPTALYGAFAGLVSASATFPVEVVRRRMMVGTAKGSTFTALANIARTEGWRSLYKGIGLTWAKQAPQYAVTFLVYDKIKEVLEV